MITSKKVNIHVKTCTEIEKKQQLPWIKRLLIPELINLLYVDCCKLCSFKDLSKSDNDSHNNEDR